MQSYATELLRHVQEDLSRLNTCDRPDHTVKSFASKALLSSLLKKFEPVDTKVQDAAALKLFLDVNSQLLDAPRAPQSMCDQYLMGELKNSLYRFWFAHGEGLVGSLNDLVVRGRCGPGSSLGAESCDSYSKLFDSQMATSNPLLYSIYRATVQRSPLLSDAEKLRFEKHGFPAVVRHSKLLFVPKSDTISRTICVEPSLNMFFQLGLADVLTQRLKSAYKIDLKTQPEKNREMALVGSRSGEFATIDLSSASDSLSTPVLKEILPAEFFAVLDLLRVPNVQLPDGSLVELKMISTMGNGFTFPLETIIFSAVVDAVYRLTELPLDRMSVFGDDIVVDRSAFTLVCRLLYLLGFKVNEQKTFNEGPFRESCGYDYFNGREVRGVYIKSLDTPQDRYVAINLLVDWSAKTGVMLARSIDYLLKSVRRVLIPPLCGLDEGIHVPQSLGVIKLDSNGSFRFRRYQVIPRRVKISDTGHLGDLRGKTRLVGQGNFPGLEASAISGCVRSGCISLRQREVHYRVKAAVLPIWDWIAAERSKRRFSFAQWETTASILLMETQRG